MTDWDIDQIVQSVLKQLQHPSVRTPAPPSELRPTEKPVKETTAPVLRHVGGRIITADLLAKEVQRGEQITIEARALITPAARDYLKEQKIIVSSHTGSGKQAAVSTGAVTKWLGLQVDTSSSLEAALKSVTQQKLTSLQIQRSSSTEEAAQTAISEINRGGASGILIFAQRAATAACFANRHERVRAVAVNRLQDQAMIQELDANVICLPERGMSVAEYLQLLRLILKKT